MKKFNCTSCAKEFQSSRPPAETREDSEVKLCSDCIEKELDAIEAPALPSESMDRILFNAFNSKLF